VTPEQEIDQLSRLCERLGSTPEQARVMAAQLQKRATQLAADGSQTREDAMAWLLRIVIEGRDGKVPQR
jgi:hypothetical protein